ncbi:MAG: threonylcarbamoyl-AMP synthase [Lachnospiraceae bacterium]|nr:threonylcarbamoyl-AMP synthase [Lachnospiraceae bacterium]
MKTIIVKLDDNNTDMEALKAAGRIIRSGGLVAFPTETVYGLGADALNPAASEKIYAAKGRPSDNPLIVHIYRLEDLYEIARDVSDAAVRLAGEYWPGPLTMIFKKKDIVPLKTTGGLDTVAVRMPSNRVAAEFIKEAGGFIAAPSANLSGRPSPTDASHVIEDMDGRIDMIIDGGSCDIGLESTIVDMTGEVPMILRPGYITGDMIKAVTGQVDHDPAVFGKMSEGLRPKAPGMKYRHYAPKGDLIIVRGEREKVISYISKGINEAAGAGRKTAVLTAREDEDAYPGEALKISVGARDDEDEIARHLYGALRQCDDEGIDIIYSEDFSTPRIGQAIMNRLIKAAGHKIVDVAGTGGTGTVLLPG